MYTEFDLAIEQKLTRPEYLPAVLNKYDPTSIVFQSGIPEDFGQIQGELCSVDHHFTSTAADVARSIYDIEQVFRLFEMSPQYPRIMRGPNGGVLMFHITPQLEQFEEAMTANNLQTIPTGYISWMRRCFGLQSTWFSDIRIIHERQGGTADPNKLCVVETHEMDKSHEVVLKQGLWANATTVMLELIRGDRDLNAALQHVLNRCAVGRGKDMLDALGARNAAFSISSGVINVFCMRHPQMTRIAFRDIIQREFRLDREAVDFGYRRETDPRFIIDENLVAAVDFVGRQLINSGLTTADELELTKEMVRCLLVNKASFVEHYYSINEANGSVKVLIPDRVLVSTFAEGSYGFMEQIRDFCNPNAVNLLRNFCNGLRPMPQLTVGNSSLLQRNVAVGTDGGSNNVLLMKKFNRRKSRLIKGSEKIALLKELQQQD